MLLEKRPHSRAGRGISVGGISGGDLGGEEGSGGSGGEKGFSKEGGV